MVNQTPVREETKVQKFVSFEKAVEIMGENRVFGIDRVMEVFDFNAPELLEGLDLKSIPYTEETLSRYKATHFLIFVLPISINNIKEQQPEVFNKSESLQKYAFAKNEGELGWMLIRSVPDIKITGKIYEEQKDQMDKNEEVLTPQPLVFLMVVNFYLNESFILVKEKSRCKNLYFDNHEKPLDLHVLVSFNEKGCILVDWFEVKCTIASYVKPDKSK